MLVFYQNNVYDDAVPAVAAAVSWSAAVWGSLPQYGSRKMVRTPSPVLSTTAVLSETFDGIFVIVVVVSFGINPNRTGGLILDDGSLVTHENTRLKWDMKQTFHHRSMDPPKVRLELRKAGKKRRHQPDVASAFGNDSQVERTQREEDTEDKEPLVIPAVANKSKFVVVPPSSTTEANNDDDDARAAMALAEDTISNQQASSSNAAAISVASNAQRHKESRTNDTDDQALYQKEMEALPKELTITDDAYDRVPIADFGAALLRGMGWQGDSSAAAAGNTKNDANETLPRPHRLGLGAVPKPMDEITHRPLRPDEYEKRKKQRQQHEAFQAQHEQKQHADPQQTLQDGSVVYLVDDKVVRARIVKLRGVPGLNRIQVQYEGDRNVTSIQKSQVGKLVPRQELLQHPFAGPPPIPDASLQSSSSKPPEIHSSKADTETKHAKKKQKKHAELSSKRESEERSWMIPHIRVRIITKKLGKSHYKAKGVVVDVTSKGATLQMPDGSLLDRVPMRYVETALPKVGGSCIIVGRKNWQTKGRLLERSSHKAIIQESENGTALTVHLDDLAEWCGPEEESNF